MEPFQLTSAFKLPAPDRPNDPNSGFSLTVEQARQLQALIDEVVEYIQVEYARCGKQATPSPP